MKKLVKGFFRKLGYELISRRTYADLTSKKVAAQTNKTARSPEKYGLQTRREHLAIDAQKEDMIFPRVDAPSPFDGSGKWEIIGGQGVNGSWESDRFVIVRALIVWNDDLYVGIGGYKAGDAQIWRYSGRKWQQVAGDGIRHSWSGQYRRVNVLLSEGEYLYAGVGDSHREGAAAIWRFDGEDWDMFAGDGVEGSWPEEYHAIVHTLVSFEGSLYAGMSSEDHENRACAYRLEGSKWVKVAGDNVNGSWGDEDHIGSVYEFLPMGEALYTATGGGHQGHLATATVWRFYQGKWSQIGGRGVLGSWEDRQIRYCETLASYRGCLIAAVSRPLPYPGPISSVWAYDGTKWGQVGSEKVPDLWNRCGNHNHLIVYHGRLYVASGSEFGSVSVWELSEGRNWRQVAGTGMWGSWSSDGGPVARKRTENAEWIYRMVEYKGDLVVGIAGYPGAAQVWRFRRSLQ